MPYGEASTQSGARTRRASGIHASRRVRTSSTIASSTVSPAPSTTEPWRFAQRTRSGKHDERPPANPATGCVHEEPEGGRVERQRSRLCADRPAPRPRDHGEQADQEGRARRGAARAGRRGRERQREEHEQDVEQHDRAHPGKPVRAVEDDLGEPLLVGPRGALPEQRDRLGRRQPVLDDLAAGHQCQPGVADHERRPEHGEQHDADERDQQDRERARLEDPADGSACRCPTEVGHRRSRAGDRSEVPFRVVSRLCHVGSPVQVSD